MDLRLLSLFRSLGFGALLGAGILGLVYAQFSETFSPHVSLRESMMIGGVLGGGLHRIIERLFEIIFRPVTDFIAYYIKLVQLLTLRHTGVITGSQANRLLRRLTDAYFSPRKR